MKKIFTLACCLLVFAVAFSQGFNDNTERNYINIVLPKTPESQSFEKYGNIPVNESSGVPNISYPLLNLKGKFLEVPVSLSYHASGIRVSQEATWVGLGFDILTGGRITIETKGNVDDNVRGFYANSTFRAGLRRIFRRFGNSNSTALMGYGFLDYGKLRGNTAPEFHSGDTAWDNELTVSDCAWYGAGEPDIYNANFGAYSVSFYIDLITDEVKLLGEKTLFNISYQRDGFNRIDNFVITDNNGIKYSFQQKEKTKLTAPPFHGTSTSYESTTAWLLTKIEHPTGDKITFSYVGYGKTYPCINWSASLSAEAHIPGNTLSTTWPQNQVEQDPYYLSKIESNNATIDFILGPRQDLRGPGSRLLEEIKLTDKLTNTIIKNIKFDYGYFISGPAACESSLADSIKQYNNRRLKLLSFYFPQDTAATRHSFYYTGPDPVSKLSLAQDHWGYYNGASNSSYLNGTTPHNLIPTFYGLGSLITRNIGFEAFVPNSGTQLLLIPNTIDGYGSRACSPYYVKAMMMDSVVYPTGGSTKFEYEPHHSWYQNKAEADLVGGGVRIRLIKSYTTVFDLASVTEYKYEETDGGRPSGVYLGAIDYVRLKNIQGGIPLTLSSSGNINADNATVGYTRVKMILRSAIDESSNGCIIKNFRFNHPLQVQYHAQEPPFYDPNYVYFGTTPVGPWNLGGVNYLLKQWSNTPPTPYRYLDGKLFREDVFDKENNLVKKTEYHYSQADYTQDFYSLRAEDNYPGGAFGQLLYGAADNGSNCYGPGSTRWGLTVTPAKSFFSLLDSIVETSYQGGQPLITRKTYKYNSYFQQEYESQGNSDGTQTIVYTKTALDLKPNYPLGPAGDAVMLYNLKGAHIYDVPVEQVTMKRLLTGDTMVVQGRLNLYLPNGLPLKIYTLQTGTPLAYRSNFVPLYCHYPNYPGSPGGASTYTLQMDSRYKLENEADYSPDGGLKAIRTTQTRSAYIWDEDYHTVLAQANEADSSDIAYSSFETPATGRWTYSAAGPVSDNTAPAGNKAYSLASGSIAINGLNTAKKYQISYWSRNGAQNVNGAPSTAGPSLNGWTYYEHQLNNPSTVTITGTGTIDNLRLFPTGSLMTTYHYQPLVGLSSQSSPNNQLTYYEYDLLGRLSRIRDDEKNILKQFEYKYGEIFQFPYGNTPQSPTWTKNDCSIGYQGSSLTYAVPEGKYGSFISVEDANEKALAAIEAYNGQARINQTGTCAPYYRFVGCCGKDIAYNQFELTGTGYVNFSIVVGISGNAYGQIGNLSGALFLPSTTRYVNVSANGTTYVLVFYPTGEVNIMGPYGSGYFQLTGTYQL